MPMKFIDTPRDPWHTVSGEDGPMVTLTPAPHSLLSWAQWRGVRELLPHLPRLARIALQFPKWTDGRAYSQARLLRRRWRFAGEIRATGEVLVDMLPLLERTGFDAALLRGDQSIEAAERALRFFPGHYQGDTKEPRPLFARPVGEQYPQGEFVHGGAAI